MQARVSIKARSGAITSTKIFLSHDPQVGSEEEKYFQTVLKDRKIHEVPDFRKIMSGSSSSRSRTETHVIADWLGTMFGT